MSIEKLIGNTPLVQIEKLNTKPNVRVFCKLEGNTPGGSVKDRAAYGMISEALKRGDIKPGDKLVEATSGNTGIALAMIAQLKGLKMHLIMRNRRTQENDASLRSRIDSHTI